MQRLEAVIVSSRNAFKMALRSGPDGSPQRGPLASTALDLSVVIPCRNGASTLGAQLRALELQDVAVKWEIIVADNASTDGTAELVSNFQSSIPIRLIDASHVLGSNHARNQGVRAARGRYLLLCDADDIVEPGWMSEMWRALDAGAVLVGGAMRRARGRQVAQRPDTTLQNGLAFLPWPYGANCGFARQVFEELGGFNEAHVFGPEVEFFWRAQLRGYQLQFVPGAVVTYLQRDTPKAVFAQKYQYGQAAVQLYTAFRTSGMPRSSTRQALVKWARLPAKTARALVQRDRWYDVAISLGFAIGRLSGSWKYRVWYP